MFKLSQPGSVVKPFKSSDSELLSFGGVDVVFSTGFMADIGAANKKTSAAGSIMLTSALVTVVGAARSLLYVGSAFRRMGWSHNDEVHVYSCRNVLWLLQ